MYKFSCKQGVIGIQVIVSQKKQVMYWNVIQLFANFRRNNRNRFIVIGGFYGERHISVNLVELTQNHEIAPIITR